MTERTARVAAPAALALFVVVGALLSRRPPALVLVLAVGVVLLGVVIIWRNVSGWRLVAALVVAGAGLTVLCAGGSANSGWFGLCILAGWAAFETRPPQALVVGGVLVVALVGQWLADTAEPGWWSWVAGTVFTTVACLFARRQRELVLQLREAQAGLADRARAEERNRIAGEMHDVIGHALTVSLLHVTSARLALDEDPEEARASLDEAERLARSSLQEVRAAVGLMRGDDPASVAPMPGARDVGELVDSFRRAGSRVELTVEGDLGSLTATGGLTVYRVVQESLTNVARHAAGSTAAVRVVVGGADAVVTVTSDGSPAPGAREGSGLAGLRERAEALGGRLVAGPTPGGWTVEAVLPT